MNAMDQTAYARVDHALRMWLDVRRTQTEASIASGRAQEGRRSAVTGGRHMDAVHQLVVDEIRATGATGLHIHKNRGATLPGFYRATKSWDLVLVQGEVPVLAIEYKSMLGSEGKNLNNRADEIFGVAEDTRQAELKGLLPPKMRRAYIFVMSDNPETSRPIGVSRTLGMADPIFDGASYVKRMAIMLRRMRDTGLFHLTWAVAVKEEPFSWYEPDPEVGWNRFAADLHSAFKSGQTEPDPDRP
jgi:restriction endonuclease XhoI-like protein